MHPSKPFLIAFFLASFMIFPGCSPPNLPPGSAPGGLIVLIVTNNGWVQTAGKSKQLLKTGDVIPPKSMVQVDLQSSLIYSNSLDGSLGFLSSGSIHFVDFKPAQPGTNAASTTLQLLSGELFLDLPPHPVVASLFLTNFFMVNRAMEERTLLYLSAFPEVASLAAGRILTLDLSHPPEIGQPKVLKPGESYQPGRSEPKSNSGTATALLNSASNIFARIRNPSLPSSPE